MILVLSVGLISSLWLGCGKCILLFARVRVLCIECKISN